MEFPRITRLAPYVFDIIGGLEPAARRAGEDVIDRGMGNADAPTPPHVVEKLVEAASKAANRYSVSKGIEKLQEAKVAVSQAVRGIRKAFGGSDASVAHG